MDTQLDGIDLAAIVPELLQLCRRAGGAICDFYHAPGADEFEAKADDSPLTGADLASDRILCGGLPDLLAHTPILSEESQPDNSAQRLSWRRYWLVDPLDGTKEFLARTGEFTINIALIEDHVPVLGVLYQPLSEVAHIGIPGTWARRYTVGADGQWQSVALSTRSLVSNETLTVLASRRHRGPRLEQCLEWLEQNWGPIGRVNSGSALKFCQLADGAGDFYPRFSPCCEWDTAAGQALLEAAGGSLVDLQGAPLRYNCGESLYSPNFYALADPGQALWRALLAT